MHTRMYALLVSCLHKKVDVLLPRIIVRYRNIVQLYFLPQNKYCVVFAKMPF